MSFEIRQEETLCSRRQWEEPKKKQSHVSQKTAETAEPLLSKSSVQSRLSDPSPHRLRHHLPFQKNRPAAHYSSHDPPEQCFPNIGTMLVAIKQLVVMQHAAVLQVNQHDIRVGAHPQVSLTRQRTEALGDISRGHSGYLRKWQLTLLVAFRQQQLQQRLAAGYPAPDLEEIAIILHTGRCGRVIRRYHWHA